MKLVTLKLTTKELELLTTLVADQLFRREFIDPKMPGYRSNPEEMSLGRTLIARLRLMLKPVPAKETTSPRFNSPASRVSPTEQIG